MKKNPHFSNAAFTLVELVVVMVVISLLAMLSFVIAGKGKEQARQAKEMNAARQLIMAYQQHANDSDGDLLKGFDKSVKEISLPSGMTVVGEMCCRYPWRLAPFLTEQVEEIYLLNDNKKATQGMTTDSFEYQYRVSLHPALGLNAYCLGGYDDGSQTGNFQKDVATKMSQVPDPTKMIVFASARMKQSAEDKDEVAGNFLIKPPKLWRTKWDANYNSTRPSASFGNVAMRWNEQAMCAFLDGSVRLMGNEEMQDMRHWSMTAQENNDPHFTVPR